MAVPRTPRTTASGKTAESHAWPLPGRQLDGVTSILTAEEYAQQAKLALIDWGGRMFAPHAPIDGLECELADMAGGVALPRTDLADAVLACQCCSISGLLNRPIGRLRGQIQHCADAGSD